MKQSPEKGMSMTTTTETKAREIVKHISDAALELAFIRHDLTSDRVDVDDDAPVKERVEAHEEWWEDVKADVLNCLTGDDTGCLDPEELDASNCELIWTQEQLALAPAPQPALDAGEVWISHFDSHHRKGEPCNQCVSSGALDTGEWRTAADFVVDAEGKSIARAKDEETAAQIVSDHRSAAAVPKLVDMLKRLRQTFESRTLLAEIDEALDAADQAGRPKNYPSVDR